MIKDAANQNRLADFIYTEYGRKHHDEFMNCWREFALDEGILKERLMTKKAIRMRLYNNTIRKARRENGG